MRFVCATILLLISAMTASPGDPVSGTWRLEFSGPAATKPKTIGSIFLNLAVNGTQVTGTSNIGAWPGPAPIANGQLTGNTVTFDATGHITSKTGIPTCHFAATLNGTELEVIMTVTKNPGGALAANTEYIYTGTKVTP